MAIAIVGMLDERQEGLELIKKRIEERGHNAILIDISIGTGAIEPAIRADITCDEVAKAGGTTIKTVRETLDKVRDKATSAIAEGLSKKLLELYEKSAIQGVIAVGGMTGTFINLTAMRRLPFGFPKLLISSAAAMPKYAKSLSEYFGVRDITVMHSVVDTVGMNPLVRALMINGAEAISGMASGYSPPEREEKPSIAITEVGGCDKGAYYLRELLGRDYNIISFHAVGIGEKAAMELIGQGLFEVFIDLVPAGFSEYLLGGNRAVGPDRLDPACKVGMPYILSTCAFEMISCGPIKRREENDPLWVSRKLAERKLYLQDELRVQARTSSEEMRTISAEVAKKLNTHPNLSVEGAVLYDPESDQSFIDELERCLDSEIEIIKVDTHINTREFAAAIVDALRQVLQ
ncbi:MAG: Tm-1-like ATP-binding domain-containing protein [Deltaproteobacteria bacterium]|nr:Tm-1-like ATP-binding domain-containing protein [Deltaproteobacteria bacterium]